MTGASNRYADWPLKNQSRGNWLGPWQLLVRSESIPCASIQFHRGVYLKKIQL